MSSTDVSNLSAAVAGIQIDGPTTPTASGRIELNDENILQVLPGEIDSAVGSVVQPTVIEDAANALTNAVADIIEEAVPGTFGDERLPVGKKEDALFDRAPYDTAPLLDGQSADELKVAFSGSVTFDATDEDSRATFEGLRLGKWVNLRVGGFVSGKAGNYAENSEGESKVVGKATVKVTDLTLVTPEQL